MPSVRDWYSLISCPRFGIDSIVNIVPSGFSIDSIVEIVPSGLTFIIIRARIDIDSEELHLDRYRFEEPLWSRAFATNVSLSEMFLFLKRFLCLKSFPFLRRFVYLKMFLYLKMLLYLKKFLYLKMFLYLIMFLYLKMFL